LLLFELLGGCELCGGLGLHARDWGRSLLWLGTDRSRGLGRRGLASRWSFASRATL
jgi:hypothetical protein